MKATSTLNASATDHLRPRLAAFLNKPYSKALLLYTLGTLVALLPVGADGWAAALKRLLVVGLSIVIFFVITLLFNRPARLNWLAVAITTGTAGVAVLGTAQVNTTSLRLTGLNYQAYTFLHGLFSFTNLPTVHQNVLGGFLVAFLPLAIGLGIWDRRWWLRLYSLLCALVITGGILITASRSAQLGLVAIAFVFALLLTAKYPRAKLVIGGLAGLVVVAGGIFVLLNGLSTLENGTSRLEVWRSTLAMVADYPLTGAGLGQFDRLFVAYATPFLAGPAQPHAHNIFLQSLVEFGLAGFIAILLSLLTTVRLLMAYYKLKFVAPLGRPVIGGALAGMAGIFVSGLLEYGNWQGKFAPAFWVLPGLLAAAGLNLGPFEYKWLKPTLRQRFKRVRLPVAGVVGVIALVLIAPLALVNLATILRPGPASETLYSGAASTSWWNAAPLRDLGQLALQRGDTDAAWTYYNQAYERNPKDWLTLLPLAQLTEDRDNPTLALAYWRQAGAAPYFFVKANEELKKTPPVYTTAETYLKRALEINPGYTDALNALVKVYTGTNRRQEAAALLTSALADNPDPGLYETAADLVDTAQERITLLLKATSLDPADYTGFWKLGEAYQENKLPEQAETAYKQALAIRPAFQWPIRSLADMYLKQNRLADAQNLLEKFIANNFFVEKPDREFVLLARVYAGQGNEAAAQATLQKAFQYNADSVAAFIFQGELSAKAGNKDQARTAYQKALNLDPNNDQAKQGLAALG